MAHIKFRDGDTIPCEIVHRSTKRITVRYGALGTDMTFRRSSVTLPDFTVRDGWVGQDGAVLVEWDGVCDADYCNASRQLINVRKRFEVRP